MQRSVDTGLLMIQTPDERAALSLLFASSGWLILDAAIQMYITRTHEQLAGISFPALACETEAGRQLGRLQGRLEGFVEVIGALREQLLPESLQASEEDTVEGDSLGLPLPSTPSQRQEGGLNGSEW